MRNTLKLWARYIVTFLLILGISTTGFAQSTTDAMNVTITAINDYYSPKQYITIPFTVSNYSGAQNVTAQLLVDGKVLAGEELTLNSTLGTTASQLRASLPETLIDGMHTLSIRVSQGTAVICEDKRFIQVLLPRLSLYADGRSLSASDTIAFPAENVDCNILFTVAPEERITSIVTSTKSYNVNANTKSISFLLDKSQSDICHVTVQSACGSQEKTYTLNVIRNSDITAMRVSALADSGSEYIAVLSGDTYELSIQTFDQRGTLQLQTQDSSARISLFNGVAYNSSEVTSQFVMSGQDIYYKATVATADVSKTYTIHISNANYAPSLSISNATEIAGTTYSSNGVYRGEYIEYGKRSTNVLEAQYAGKTHGIVVEVNAADRNLGQYLAGSLNIQGTQHKIHWGSFDGPTIVSAASNLKGYIYIDSSYFTENIPMAPYLLSVSDYADSSARESLSTTYISISFAITIDAGKFTAYFDPGVNEIILGSSTGGTFTYRKSSDNGLTWSEPQTAVNKIIASDPGTTLYEITLTDSMMNKISKLITVDLPKRGMQLDGVNIFLSTTRHADYILVNTKKQNISSIDLELFSLFTETKGE